MTLSRSSPFVPVHGTVKLAVAIIALATSVTTSQASQCPAELRSATRLLLVTTPNFNAFKGSMVTYARSSPTAAWQPSGNRRPIVVGRKGLAWGWTATSYAKAGEPLKREGDKRAPAGIFAIGRPFGTSDKQLKGFVRLKHGQHFCVDDTRSKHYGRIVSRGQAGRSTSGEEMSKISLYRQGLVVNYPPNAKKRAGSCIFVHVWRRPNSPTVGCVAASEADVGRMQKFASGNATVIAIIPETVRARFRDCLPQI